MDIIEQIKEAGIIGAGGAGFPTHIKYQGNFQTIIINGAECEPLLEKDIYLMEMETEQVFSGLNKLLQKFPDSSAIFATKAKYLKAIKALDKYITKNPRIELYLLDNYYPAGDEFELVYQITGKAIPPGGLPLDFGCVVSNVETIYNIDLASRGVAVTDKFVTINGEVDKAGIYRLPIGTEFREILEFAGVTIADPAILEGGPMMGILAQPSDVVKKTTAGIVVAEKEHPMVRSRLLSIEGILRIAASTCTQCTFCTELCSRYLLGHPLEPHKIMRSVSHSLYSELAILSSALICSECGICEMYACPMGISPRTINKHLKETLWKNEVRWQKPEGHIEPRVEKRWRFVPTDRILQRLRLTDYDIIDKQSQVETFSPTQVILKLLQHTGAPSMPVVRLNERVSKGQLVAECPAGQLGANLHASIDGTVKSIDKTSITIAK